MLTAEEATELVKHLHFEHRESAEKKYEIITESAEEKYEIITVKAYFP